MATKKSSPKTTKAKPAAKKINLSTNQKVGIGVGLTAAAVTAAGAYFLYGSKNAAKNRRSVKSWMFNAKAEVLSALERAEEMTEAEYNRLVETVGKTYSTLKDASQADIAAFKKEMKDHWPEIVKEGKAIGKTVSKVVSKPAAKKAAPRQTSAKKNSGGQAKKKTTARKAPKKVAKK